MSGRGGREPGRHERGAALLLAVILVLVVGALAAAVSITTRTETLISANFRQGRETLHAAEGALALAIRDLAGIPDWSAVLTGAAASSFTDGAAIGSRRTPGGDVVVLCCGAGSLTEGVQQRVHGTRSWGADTPDWQIFAWGPVAGWLPAGRIRAAIYVVVWVADDPGDGDGNPAADSNGMVHLHAQAIGPLGARRLVEALVQRQVIGDGGHPGPGARVLSWREVRW